MSNIVNALTRRTIQRFAINGRISNPVDGGSA